MSEQTIKCPQCGCEISISDAMQTRIEAKFKEEYAKRRSEDERRLQEKEELVASKLQEAENAKKGAEAIIADRLNKERIKLEQMIRKMAKEEAENEHRQKLDFFTAALAEKEQKLALARDAEVELLKAQAKLREEKSVFEAEMIKRLEADRARISAEETQKALEANQNTIAQLQKRLTDATKANEELALKLRQGSQQAQGEVEEIRLEEALKSAFIFDNITPVPKGVSGADIIHEVFNRANVACGKIAWEVKETKSWNKEWIAKLKNDAQACKADIAVIVSAALPQEIAHCAMIDGVWVCSMGFAVPLATLLRDKLEALARERTLAIGKSEKMELLYSYLTGSEFRQKVESIIFAFTNMQSELDAEKRFFTKKWAKTERLIAQVLTS
ncbi:MAG: DUF2130 domain-containing protein, partial [Helicobacteraceae bacterium]|nr:DUF2130 domain-containing protein [Helicobacteraceae bacterium]